MRPDRDSEVIMGEENAEGRETDSSMNSNGDVKQVTGGHCADDHFEAPIMRMIIDQTCHLRLSTRSRFRMRRILSSIVVVRKGQKRGEY